MRLAVDWNNKEIYNLNNWEDYEQLVSCAYAEYTYEDWATDQGYSDEEIANTEDLIDEYEAFMNDGYVYDYIEENYDIVTIKENS